MRLGGLNNVAFLHDLTSQLGFTTDFWQVPTFPWR